jgi:pimeloyl-ACP methyl ester carboxylesterase
MSTITVGDGTTIYYKDWGEGPFVTCSHGWPLSSDAWDGQMLSLRRTVSVWLHTTAVAMAGQARPRSVMT